MLFNHARVPPSYMYMYSALLIRRDLQNVALIPTSPPYDNALGNNAMVEASSVAAKTREAESRFHDIVGKLELDGEQGSVSAPSVPQQNTVT